MGPATQRRQHDASEESTYSILSEGFKQDLTITNQLSQILDDLNISETTSAEIRPLTDLGRMLSINSAVTTTSSFAEKQQAATESNDFNLEHIGEGNCGVILFRSGSEDIFKVAKPQTKFSKGSLHNDYLMHTAVLAAMKAFDDIDGLTFARVPQFHMYTKGANDLWWSDNAPFKAEAAKHDLQLPADVLSTERIMPLPLPVRSQLIDTFCHPTARKANHGDKKNNDCLIRVYLGKRRSSTGLKRFFSLRNFQLHLDQMLTLGMDPTGYAIAMAGTLAILHWKARIDARDIEFVLGSSPEKAHGRRETRKDATGTVTYDGPKTRSILNWRRRIINLWLLDFNMCEEVTMDRAGVDKIVSAWTENDAYYPKPAQQAPEDRQLWKVFAERYLVISNTILESKPDIAHLPLEVLKGVTEVQEKHESFKREQEESDFRKSQMQG